MLRWRLKLDKITYRAHLLMGPNAIVNKTSRFAIIHSINAACKCSLIFANCSHSIILLGRPLPHSLTLYLFPFFLSFSLSSFVLFMTNSHSKVAIATNLLYCSQKLDKYCHIVIPLPLNTYANTTQQPFQYP